MRDLIATVIPIPMLKPNNRRCTRGTSAYVVNTVLAHAMVVVTKKELGIVGKKHNNQHVMTCITPFSGAVSMYNGQVKLAVGPLVKKG
jgi:hypothetical protein